VATLPRDHRDLLVPPRFWLICAWLGAVLTTYLASMDFRAGHPGWSSVWVICAGFFWFRFVTGLRLRDWQRTGYPRRVLKRHGWL
jgi:hypothetical protein